MTSSSPPTGLRERKKARTRAAIREHAMRLFDSQGYAATTVEKIAEAADVSPSTFFRYFPTKEDVVLSDEYDPLMVASLRTQPADLHPVAAIRRSLRAVFGDLTTEQWAGEQHRQRLIASVPELRARSLQQYLATIDLLAGVVAERTGVPAGDFAVRVLAGAVIGALLGATSGGLTPPVGADYFADFDRALGLLEAGLPVGSTGAA